MDSIIQDIDSAIAITRGAIITVTTAVVAKFIFVTAAIIATSNAIATTKFVTTIANFRFRFAEPVLLKRVED